MLAISKAISSTSLKSAFIPFITAGYPNMSVTFDVINILDKQGVSAIEIGIPYSDALADGKVIQESSKIALQQAIYLDQVLMLVRRLNDSIKSPIILFTYLNPILAKGISIFIREIAQCGAKGLVIPDLPLEEADYLISVCNYYKIELILFISPCSSDDRIQQILLKAPGCIYLVSSYGVTGIRKKLQLNIQPVLQKIKQQSSKPIMLGFGIADEKQIAQIMNFSVSVDAIVIGSAFINQVKRSYDSNNYEYLNKFCNRIKSAMLMK